MFGSCSSESDGWLQRDDMGTKTAPINGSINDKTCSMNNKTISINTTGHAPVNGPINATGNASGNEKNNLSNRVANMKILYQGNSFKIGSGIEPPVS